LSPKPPITATAAAAARAGLTASMSADALMTSAIRDVHHDHGDEDGGDGVDYSMDDFDTVTPVKSALASSISGNKYLQQTNLMTNSTTKVVTAPVVTRTLSVEEEAARKSLEDIKNRWLNPTPAAVILPSFPTIKEEEVGAQEDALPEEKPISKERPILEKNSNGTAMTLQQPNTVTQARVELGGSGGQTMAQDQRNQAIHDIMAVSV
jgi:hypothetical protein